MATENKEENKQQNISELTMTIKFGIEYKEALYHLASCKNKENTILICGGCGNDNSSLIVWEYNTDSKQYRQLTSMPENVANHKIFTINNKLFVLGLQSKHIFIYDIQTNQWSKPKISINLKQGLFGVDDSSEYIHIMPYKQTTHFVLNTKTLNITQLGDTPFETTNNGYVIYHNLKLYIIFFYLKEMYIYDTTAKQWTKGAAREAQNQFFGCVQYKHYIVTTGGLGTGMSDKINIYDIRNNKWALSKAILPIQLWGLTATIIGNNIHTFGGYSCSHLNTHMIITINSDEQCIDYENENVIEQNNGENSLEKYINNLDEFNSKLTVQYSLDRLKNMEFHGLMSLKHELHKLSMDLNAVSMKMEEVKTNLETLTALDVSEYKQWTLSDICNYAMSIPLQNKYIFGASTVNKLKEAGISAQDLPDLDRSDIREYFGIKHFQDSKKLHGCFQKLR
eukprot:542552_1